jgi:hypothetical protein
LRPVFEAIEVKSTVGTIDRAAKCAEPDPIFAAIDHHKAAWAAFEAALARENTTEERLSVTAPEKLKSNFYGGTFTIVETYDPEYAMAVRATYEAADEHKSAAAALLNIAPTTIAGVVTMLDYAYQFESKHVDCFPDGYNDDWAEKAGDQFGISFLTYLCKHLSLSLSAIMARPTD